jgi:hypothetical protein
MIFALARKCNKLNQVEREAKSLKSLRKWFDISPMRVTFKA